MMLKAQANCFKFNKRIRTNDPLDAFMDIKVYSNNNLDEN